MQCWNCHKEVAEGSVNCPHCSASLNQAVIDQMATMGPNTPRQQIVEGVLVNGRYQIKQEIGRGGMGIVYLAHDNTMSVDVALKVIPQEICYDPVAVESLKKETAIALQLTHANIVRHYNLHSWEGQAFVTMEYVPGGTLSHFRLSKGGKLSLDEALPYISQVADGLNYSHNATPAVVHRDLKPLNILLGENNEVKIADFGLARVLRDSASRISGHDNAGTLAYMAPEQIRGKGIGKKSDIYALAAITYEMLAGNPPFYTGDLRWQIMHEPVEPIEGQPDQVNTALLRALAKEPADRPESAVAFIKSLQQENPGKKPKKKKITRLKPDKATKEEKKTSSNKVKFAFLFCLLFLLGGSTAALYLFKNDNRVINQNKSSFSISSTPTGAQVYLDEKSVGKTPYTQQKFAAGPHTVRLLLEQYQPYTKQIYVDKNTPFQLQATLVPEVYGEINITSTPSGAEVSIDDQTVGNTPLSMTNIRAGMKNISLTKDGYSRWENSIEIKPLKIAKIQAALVPSSGELSITSNPTGAIILLDGKQLGMTPLLNHSVLQGSHVLTLKKKNYHSQEKQIEITDNPASFKITLQQNLVKDVTPEPVNKDEKLTGSLFLDSSPDNATIYIDNNNVGKTPLTLSHIPYGIKQIRFERKDYIPLITSLKVSSPTTRLHKNLVLKKIDNTGSLHIETVPVRASIAFTNPKFIYKHGMKLPDGNYPLTISATGYDDRTIVVSIKKGEETTKRIELTKHATLTKKEKTTQTAREEKRSFKYIP